MRGIAFAARQILMLFTLSVYKFRMSIWTRASQMMGGAGSIAVGDHRFPSCLLSVCPPRELPSEATSCSADSFRFSERRAVCCPRAEIIDRVAVLSGSGVYPEAPTPPDLGVSYILTFVDKIYELSCLSVLFY